MAGYEKGAVAVGRWSLRGTTAFTIWRHSKAHAVSSLARRCCKTQKPRDCVSLAPGVRNSLKMQRQLHRTKTSKIPLSFHAFYIFWRTIIRYSAPGHGQNSGDSMHSGCELELNLISKMENGGHVSWLQPASPNCTRMFRKIEETYLTGKFTQTG